MSDFQPLFWTSIDERDEREAQFAKLLYEEDILKPFGSFLPLPLVKD